MSSFDHVHNLMVAIGDLMDLPQVTEYTEQSAWLLVTEAGPVVVDYEGGTDRLLLTSGIGTPEPGGRAALYQALLLHNEGLADPWGVRAGLDEPEGEVVLLAERRATGLDATGLQALLQELGVAATAWRERLRQPPADGAGIADMFGAGMIRV